MIPHLRGFIIEKGHSYYWIVRGEVPLDVAKELYEHPLGRRDVRVSGHCMCPAPEPPWLSFYGLNDEEVIHDPTGREEREWDDVATRLPLGPKPRFSRNAFAEAEAFVTTYHVDSKAGLLLLVEAMKRYRERRRAEDGGGNG